MLSLRSNANLGLLQQVDQLTQKRALVQRTLLARLHGHEPLFCLDVLGVRVFLDALVARVCEDMALFTCTRRGRGLRR